MSTNDRPPGWPRSPRPQQPKPAGRPARRWLLPGLILGALVGILAGVLLFPGRTAEPVVLAVAVTEYEHADWPANPMAAQDARGFRGRFAEDAVQAFQSQRKQVLREKLDEAAAKAVASERPLVVYLSALGTVGGDTPYLLPADATPDDPAGWLTLGDVLTPLTRSNAPTLLILDVRPTAAPRAVLPTGDVNERLDAELAALAGGGQLPLTVLHANTPRDGPAVLHPLMRTAFGLAAAQAIGGAADGWGGGEAGDGVLTVREFTAYVKAVTHSATTAFGGGVQTPTVRGTGADFRLLPVPKAVELVPTGPDPPADEKYPPALDAAWKEADAAFGSRLHLRAPKLLQPYLTATTRAELRWLAGLDADAAAQSLHPKPDAFRAEVAKRPAVRSPAVSVARSAGGVKPADHGRPAEPTFRATVLAVRNPNPEKKGELAEELGKIRADKTDPPLPFDVVAAFILDTAPRLPKPTQDQIRGLLDAAKAHPSASKPHPPVAELITLELIAGLPADQFARWQDAPNAIPMLIDAAVAAERAAAFDARFFPWVKTELVGADGHRRKALIALCDPAAATADVRAVPRELDDAVVGYRRAETVLSRVRAAQAEVEETRAVIDDLGVFGPPDPGMSAEAWKASVVEMAEAVKKLARLIGPPFDGPPPGDDVVALTNRLRDVRAAVVRRFAVPQHGRVRELEHLLGWPRWPLAVRQTLHAELKAKSAEATDQVLAAWPRQPTADPTGPAPRAAGVPTESVHAVQAAVALLDLQLSGRENARTAVDLRAKFDALGAGVDTKAFTELSRQTLAARRRATDADAGRDPELDAHRKAERAFAEWLATERYQADAEAVGRFPFRDGFAPAERWREVARALRD